ncbi:hypothetical protein A1122_05830 [Yersinia pestis A1122]|nr:hypothetical protein A1122_05830 [Yersinia pestis A1122]QOW16212.1 hypothetical protein S96127_3910 [Yersinia pestis]QPA91936.1 hypothetical protein ISU57_01390 [Yersinia pestis]QUG34490.1 hypothetical protein IM067_20490 [Yersinia pestis]
MQKKPITLAFRGGYFRGATGVNDPPPFTDVILFELLPRGPVTGGCETKTGQQQEHAG